MKEEQGHLTAEDVREIRRLYRDQDRKQTALAEQFGVSQGQISRIINRKRWAGVQDD